MGRVSLCYSIPATKNIGIPTAFTAAKTSAVSKKRVRRRIATVFCSGVF